MNLKERIALMARLGEYMKGDDDAWAEAKERAYAANGWFTPEFIRHASLQIANNFLAAEKLTAWAAHYHIDDNIQPKNVGIIMAGNIPLVGFHDLLSVFITGHKQTVKLSSKDSVLMNHLYKVLSEWQPGIAEYIQFAEMLKGCDAYIATGSNNSARAFKEYFGKYPHIIRRNRTSVAVLTGNETTTELNALSDDIHLYFGLGCRNVTKLYVPQEYDFVPLLGAFGRYKYFADHHKYKNNFDYQLSILLLNNVYYMSSNDAVLLTENKGLFSPISQVFYEYYSDQEKLKKDLGVDTDIQAIVGKDHRPFGSSQEPGLFTYADGADTLQFLLGL